VCEEESATSFGDPRAVELVAMHVLCCVEVGEPDCEH